MRECVRPSRSTLAKYTTVSACETKRSKSYLYFNENVLKESQNPFTFEAATAAPAHRRNLKLANSARQLGQEQAQRSLLRACKERRGSTLWVLQRSRGFTGQERGSRMGLSLIRSWWILSWVYERQEAWAGASATFEDSGAHKPINFTKKYTPEQASLFLIWLLLENNRKTHGIYRFVLTVEKIR